MTSEMRESEAIASRGSTRLFGAKICCNQTATNCEMIYLQSSGFGGYYPSRNANQLFGSQQYANQQYVNFIHQPQANGYMNAGFSGTAYAIQQQAQQQAPPQAAASSASVPPRGTVFISLL